MRGITVFYNLVEYFVVCYIYPPNVDRLFVNMILETKSSLADPIHVLQ